MLHNYNILLIYGFKNKKLYCCLNLGFKGSKEMVYEYEELLKILIDKEIYNQLRLRPLLIKKKHNILFNNNDIKKSINNYYFSLCNNNGYITINEFLHNFSSIIERVNSNYDVTASFVLLGQFKNVQLKQMHSLSYHHCIELVRKQIENINFSKLEYIKWMYDKKIIHLETIYKYLRELYNYELLIRDRLLQEEA